MDLTSINGVGKSKAKKLIAAGIETVEQLAALTDERLVELDIKQSWIDQARAMVTKSEETAEPEQTEEVAVEKQDPASESAKVEVTEVESVEASQTESVVESKKTDTETPEATEPEQTEDVVQLEKIDVVFQGGLFKGRKMVYEQGKPGVLLGYQPVHISSLSVEKVDSNDGETKFKLFYGVDWSSAVLPDDQFKAIASAINKAAPVAANYYQPGAGSNFSNTPVAKQSQLTSASTANVPCKTCGG